MPDMGSTATVASGRRGAVLGSTAARRGDWLLLRPVLMFHLVTRLMVLAGLAFAAIVSGRTFPSVLTRWDGRWYLKLAAHGYPSPLPTDPSTGRVLPNVAGFFPVFPWMVRALMAVGIPFWIGGLVINLIAAGVAVLLIVLVGAQYLDRHAAQLVGCLWSVFPVSAVLTTTYTEAVFTVFGAAALLFLLRRRWILAGLAALLAGMTRAPGLVFAGAVALGALEAIIRRREWRSLIGAAIAPLGYLAVIGYIGLRTGRMDAWHATEQDGWHERLTFGRGWLSFLASPYPSHEVTHVLTAIVSAGVLVLAVAAVVLRPPIPIIGLVVVGTFMAFAFGGVSMDSTPRFMMSFFPVLAPSAIWLARRTMVVRWTVLAAGAVLAAVVGGYYFAFSPVSP